MKKNYEKPMLLCEDIAPETLLCGCKIKNPTLNEEWHCGYEPDGLGFPVFAELWDDCFLTPDEVPVLDLCYHTGTTNLFGS